MPVDPRDPKGHYAALGVAPDATAEAIRKAWRRRAKEVHPDINPDPGATEAFRRLTAAWEVLSDAAARQRYDEEATPRQKPRPTAQPRPAPPRAAEPPPAPERPRKPAEEPPRRPPDPPPAEDEADGRPVRCQSCGTIPAQPRIVAHEVVRRGRRVRLGGAMCPRCAERAGIGASLGNWTKSVWRWPAPTLAAVAVNVASGFAPRDANRRLICKQARYFTARGRHDIAHTLYGQALAFADAADAGPIRNARERLLPDRPPPRDVWARRSRVATLLHLAPPMAVCLAFSIVPALYGYTVAPAVGLALSVIVLTVMTRASSPSR
jgi:hypothetical protein